MRASLVRSPVPAVLAAVCMLSAALVAAGPPAGAAARPSAGAAAADPGPAPRSGTGPVLLAPTPGVGEKVARTSPKLIEAVQRDMRLTRAAAITRLGRQDAAGAAESRARRAAGRSFAGSWLNSDGSSLMVAVTDRLAGPSPVTAQTRLFDRAFVQFNTGLGTQALPAVRSGLFSTIPVVGSTAARVGSMVCSFGRSSGYRCGSVLATGQDMILSLRDSVDNRGTPTFVGLNTARFCSSEGDSGGPVITPEGQAQGTIVSSDCGGVGFTSTYQPINRTMHDLQVRLKLAGTRPPTPGPVITSFTCDSFGDAEYARFTCELYWIGGTEPKQVQVSSNGRWLRRIDESDYNYYVLAGDCAPVGSTYARVAVVDDDGRRDEDSNPSVCSLS